MDLSEHLQRAIHHLTWIVLSLGMIIMTLCRWTLQWMHQMRHSEKIPGPIPWPIFGNCVSVLRSDSRGLFVLLEYINKTYGRIYRAYMGPFLLVLTGNYQDHEKVLSANDYLEKGIIYFLLKPWLGEGLLITSGEKWHSRRKLLTPAFHFKILGQFVPVFNTCGDEYVRQLRTHAEGGAAVDVWPLTKLLTLDVICETIMGVRMNTQTDSKSPYVTAVNDISSIIVERGMKPWNLLPFIFRLTKLGRRHQECLDILHSTTEKVIQERKVEFNKLSENHTLDVDELGRRRRVAFLDLLLLMAKDGNLTDLDIREEVDTFMFEGHDTTASAISFTIYFLSRHPNVQDKVLAELESIFDTSKPLEPSIQDLSELKYLEMVIKESMRICPPVSAVARDITTDMKLESRPLIVPYGSTLFLSFYLLHRDPEVFPDPETFDPERFSPEQTVGRNPFAYLPFSAGSRNCIGQRFAMLELKSVLAKVVWNFRILPDPEYEPLYIWELILKTSNGIFVQLEERSRE